MIKQCAGIYACPVTPTTGLSKNRRDDGTGRSIHPAAGGHIVDLMMRRGGRWDSNYCQLMKA